MGQWLVAHHLSDAIWRVPRIAEEVGVHAIGVVALDNAAKQFCKNHAFTELVGIPSRISISVAMVRELKRT